MIKFIQEIKKMIDRNIFYNGQYVPKEIRRKVKSNKDLITKNNLRVKMFRRNYIK